MDAAGYLILIAVLGFIGIALAIRVSRSRAGRDSGERSPRVVTTNLDYTILGQRPEIITEDDPDPSPLDQS